MALIIHFFGYGVFFFYFLAHLFFLLAAVRHVGRHVFCLFLAHSFRKFQRCLFLKICNKSAVVNSWTVGFSPLQKKNRQKNGKKILHNRRQWDKKKRQMTIAKTTWSPTWRFPQKKSKRKKRKRFFFLNFNAFDHPPQRPFIWKGKLEGEWAKRKKNKPRICTLLGRNGSSSHHPTKKI